MGRGKKVFSKRRCRWAVAPTPAYATRVKLGMTIQHRLDNHPECTMYVFWAFGVFEPNVELGFDKITPDGKAANERAAKSGDSGRGYS